MDMFFIFINGTIRVKGVGSYGVCTPWHLVGRITMVIGIALLIIWVAGFSPMTRVTVATADPGILPIPP